ncbi:MAG: STAS domain-containing protein [Spirochaetes bacterium]|nr:STAS domain-containing protein [Spirochaetota bacterium]
MDYIKLEKSGDDLRLIFLKTELVFSSTSFILEFLEKTIYSAGGGKVVLDLSNVNHIDSSAVGMFISLKNGMQKAGRDLYIDGVCENVLRILNFLDITGFLNLNAA